jgi:hypothetical protein
MNDEEQKQLIRHLLNMLKTIYREQIVYVAFFEYMKTKVGSRNADEVLNECRLDPAAQTQTDAYFRDYEELIRLSDAQSAAALRQALFQALLDRWKPDGTIN